MKHQLKWYFLLLPLCLCAAEPVLYMPLDDSADVIGPKGGKIAAGIVHGRTGYQPGVIGKGLDVKRHAYDQATALTFTNMPAMDCSSGTVSFWFKPHWKETDPESHTILSARDAKWKGFRCYLIKGKNGTIELSVCSPKQVQILRKNLFKQGEWHHVAFTWDQAKGEARLYINGKSVGERTIPGAYKKYDAPINLNLYCGWESTDRFKANVGNGVYDELKVFDKPLNSSEIFVLASGGAGDKLSPLSLAPAARKGNSLEFAFRNKESRLPGPN